MKHTKELQEKVWNNIAASWKERREKEIPLIKEFLKNKKGDVLDYGCGAGRNLIPHTKIEYHAVDFSQEQLKYAEQFAKENNQEVIFYKAELDNPPKNLLKKQFDAGLFIAALHCLTSEEKRKKALTSFHTLLKPGAEALISVWDKNQERFNNLDKETYVPWEVDSKENLRYYYLYEKEEFITLLKETGFTIEEIYPQDGGRFQRRNVIVRVKK